MTLLLSYPHQTALGGRDFWSPEVFGENYSKCCIDVNWTRRCMIEFVYHFWPNLESCTRVRNFHVFKMIKKHYFLRILSL